MAIRPIGGTYTPGNHIDGPDIADAQHASTAQKSPASGRSNGPYAVSDDDLRAAAIIALQCIVGPADILSIEPFHWSRSQET